MTEREKTRNQMNRMQESLFLIFHINGDAAHVATHMLTPVY